MAVNTAALKTFAPAMRRQLMEAVGRKLDLLLNSQTPDTLSTYAKQIAELRDEQEKSREQLLERVAYTWFNRLCALRYLDAKGWHPFGCKVLMPADGSETQPELLKLMRSGSLPADLKTFTNEQRLNQLLDGQIPTAIPGGDAQGEVYRELVLAACRSYHKLLPDLFEGLDDASELLLPDDLLTEGSITGSFRSSITDSDCEDVEIIGWLYQFYISEKKDEVIGKVVKAEDIPAATQLFTPNWIVKYMVQNTIGAQWLATYPDSPLREQMEFYIEPAEQTDEVKAKPADITPTSLNPEELTLMDPACGSGHILVEAYEIFKAIYLEQGYQLREIPQLIFEKNLYGLDIDQRAAQLTTFALIMKGRKDDRRLFERQARLNIFALKDSKDIATNELANLVKQDKKNPIKDLILRLKRTFEYASTYGSLISVAEELKVDSGPLISELKYASASNLLAQDSVANISQLAWQAKMLSMKFDAVCSNPPYMGSKGMNKQLKEMVRKDFPASKNDLFACFIERSLSLVKKEGRIGMITMQGWMFLSSFQKIREMLISECTIESMAHLGPRGFAHASAMIVQTTAFILSTTSPGKHKPIFLRLLEGDENAKRSNFGKREIRYQSISQNEFKKIPNSPLAYWVSESFYKAYEEGKPLGSLVEAAAGLQTGNNDQFLRAWHEVPRSSIGFNIESRESARFSVKKWFPYNKGGGFRRWWGNHDYLVNWEQDGLAIHNAARIPLEFSGAPVRAKRFYFKPSLSWSDITFGPIAFRLYEKGFIHDVSGMSAFTFTGIDRQLLAAFCNSPVARYFARTTNPTLHFQIGDFVNIPFLSFLSKSEIKEITARVNRLKLISASDWNQYERSWDFKASPLTAASGQPKSNIKTRYGEWRNQSKAIILETKELEETNNKLFVHGYKLQDELEHIVPIEEISLTINPAYRYGGDSTEKEKWERFQRDSMSELLSYATGCMMGRYSLDHPGLILADSHSNQDEQLAAYEAKIGKAISEIQFKPDADAIIPVLDGEWFEDDIVARTREFLKVTFPESSVAENLRFIEDSIGKDIRKYFCKDFYKDHLQTYKKRPIYWMVQSPKAGFACLIYLHRYTPDTLLQVLNNYFRPYLQKLEARQEQLERDQNNDALPKREQTAARKEAEKITKVLKECQAWEQDALLPLAQRRIELDLDDGVKVNYLKLQEVLAKIPGLAAKGD